MTEAEYMKLQFYIGGLIKNIFTDDLDCLPMMRDRSTNWDGNQKSSSLNELLEMKKNRSMMVKSRYDNDSDDDKKEEQNDLK